MRCPTCRQPVTDRLIVSIYGFALIDGETVDITPIMARILDVLQRNEIASVDTLADILGCHRKTVPVHVTKLRERLAPTALGVGYGYGGGYAIRWRAP